MRQGEFFLIMNTVEPGSTRLLFLNKTIKLTIWISRNDTQGAQIILVYQGGFQDVIFFTYFSIFALLYV